MARLIAPVEKPQPGQCSSALRIYDPALPHVEPTLRLNKVLHNRRTLNMGAHMGHRKKRFQMEFLLI